MSAEPGGVPSPVVESSRGERQTPGFVRQHLPYLRQKFERLDRYPMGLTVCLKRALHFTGIGLTGEVPSGSNHAIIGTTQEVLEDIRRCQDIGIRQLTFDYRTGQVDDTLKIVEHFAAVVAPSVRDEWFSRAWAKE